MTLQNKHINYITYCTELWSEGVLGPGRVCLNKHAASFLLNSSFGKKMDHANFQFTNKKKWQKIHYNTFVLEELPLVLYTYLHYNITLIFVPCRHLTKWRKLLMIPPQNTAILLLMSDITVINIRWWRVTCSETDLIFYQLKKKCC